VEEGGQETGPQGQLLPPLQVVEGLAMELTPTGNGNGAGIVGEQLSQRLRLVRRLLLLLRGAEEEEEEDAELGVDVELVEEDVA
jgi:hypothetical protein